MIFCCFLLVFVGLADHHETRNQVHATEQSGPRIGNPRVGRLDYIRSRQTFAEIASFDATDHLK